MLGLETTVSIGKQASATDPTTLGRKSLNVYSISGGQTEDDADDPILGGGLNNEEDPTEPAPGLDDHAVTIKGPLCINQFPWWMAAFFGTATTDDTDDPDFVHAWKTGQALPYIFLEHRLKSGRYRRHFALVGESLEIDLSAERAGFGMFTATFRGLKEATATSALPGTVADAPALDRPAQKLVAITYNGVAGGDIMGGSFKYSRDLKRLRAASGAGVPYAVERNGKASFDGKLSLRYHDDTFVDDGVAKTQRAAVIELLRTPARGIRFGLPHMRLTRTPISIDGPDGVEYEMAFRAWQTVADAALEVSALSPDETIAFA